MATPPVPPAFEQLESRPFSFHPGIVGFEFNEWRFRQATWSEVLVANFKTGEELWVPRRYVEDTVSLGEPMAIVGLNRELEFKGGMLVPFQRRVLKMPGAGVRAPSTKPDGDEPFAPVKGSRLSKGDKGVMRLVAVALAAFILLYVGAVNYRRIAALLSGRVVYTVKDQSFLELSGRDDRFVVVSKLGQPGWEHPREVGTIYYVALGYPNRRYTVILMGSDPKSMAYIGTMDDNWRPVHSISFRSGGSSDSLLRSLERF